MKAQHTNKGNNTNSNKSSPPVKSIILEGQGINKKEERDNRPASHIYIKGKNMKEMRDFAEAYFENAFVHISLNREKWKFDIMIKNYNDKARKENFENRFKNCIITNFKED